MSEKFVKVRVIAGFVYEDELRKVECVQFKHDHFGLRLTNKEDVGVIKFGLSKIAVEQIILGLSKILRQKESDIGLVKFILDEPTHEMWGQVKP